MPRSLARFPGIGIAVRRTSSADERSISILVLSGGLVPRRARVRTWPVCELSGAILAYTHPSGEPPRWYPDAIDGWTDSEWTRAQLLPPWRVRTHVQEFGENAVDLAHAVVLHDQFARAA